MQKRVKKKAHEKLDDASIKKVKGLLSGDKPITKKEACRLLNITYNTTRLQSIIDNYDDKIAFRKKRKEQNRGKPATDTEIKEIIADHMRGEPLTHIAQRLYRSTNFVKRIIENLGIPQRPSNEETRREVYLLPEECIAEDFEIGDKVWSAVYHKAGEIIEECDTNYYEKHYASKCYRVYIAERVEEPSKYFPTVEMGGFNTFSLAYDLGSLKHLGVWL